MATRIRLRRGTSVQWTSANPILSLGEFGYETNTARFKIGDGATEWNQLAYNDPLVTLSGDVVGSGRGVIDTAINSVSMSYAKIDSDIVTINQNNTAFVLDSFLISQYNTADYLIQRKQGTKMSSSRIMVMWDGTNLYVHEYAMVDSENGSPNVTINASESSGTITLSATSPDAATTFVIIKSAVTYIKT